MTLRKKLWITSIPVLAIAAWWVVFKAPLPFVAAWWNVDAEAGTTLQTRYRIADRLVTSGRLDGMNRQQVIALLGEPLNDVNRMGNPDLLYVLGPERGFFRIDYEWLLVDFGPSGKVSKVRVARD